VMMPMFIYGWVYLFACGKTINQKQSITVVC
jgi:hypothetical protein